MPDAPRDYNICPCCGTEFGNDDADLSHEELRTFWIANGANWFFGAQPVGWNPYLQLIQGNLMGDVPRVPVTTARGQSTSASTLLRQPGLGVQEVDLVAA